jgi:hypothetical protein
MATRLTKAARAQRDEIKLRTEIETKVRADIEVKLRAEIEVKLRAETEVKLRTEIALHMVDAQVRRDIMVENLEAVYAWVLDRTMSAKPEK